MILMIHILLLLGCILMVWFIGRLAGHPGQKGTEAVTESSQEESREPDGDDAAAETGKATLSDAEAWNNGENGENGRGSGWSEAYRKWYWKNRYPKETAAETESAAPEEPYVPPVIMMASDTHYMSSTTHDDGEAFWKMVKSDDGKISQYSDEMMDALCQEAIDTKPAALVLSGDITLNGERENHEELAKKLRRVQQAGVPVVVIPGNHDISNKNNAATYFGEKKEKAEYLHSAQDFYDIYHEFGYDQSPNRDPDSLSYVYPVDATHWLLMLDSCQYEDYNHVNGKIKPETLAWLEVHLKVAQENGIAVLPVAHHNLLSQSRMYTTECTLENHDAVVGLLEQYQVPLYVSGHLHAQRIKKHKGGPGVPEDAYGITEIVLGPYSVTSQYGVLAWDEEDNMSFHTKKADVAAYAASQGSDNEELLQFGTFSENFTKQVIMEQAGEEISAIPEYLEDQMKTLYANLYLDYCEGNRMSWDQVDVTKGYKLWLRVSPNSEYVDRMSQMVEDVQEDLHDWSWENTGPGVGAEQEVTAPSAELQSPAA